MSSSAAFSSSKQDRTFLQAPKRKKNEQQDAQFTDFQKQLTRRTRCLFHIGLEDEYIFLFPKENDFSKDTVRSEVVFEIY